MLRKLIQKHTYRYFSNQHQIQNLLKEIRNLSRRFDVTEIDDIIGGSARRVDVGEFEPRSAVKTLFVNNLQANAQLEDRWNAGFSQLDGRNKTLLFNVIDGHSGKDCANIVNRYANEYLGPLFLSEEDLAQNLKEYKESNLHRLFFPFIPGVWESPHDTVRHRMTGHIIQHLSALNLESRHRPALSQQMEKALQALDRDICIPPTNSELESAWMRTKSLLRIALSGAVGVFGVLNLPPPNDNLDNNNNETTKNDGNESGEELFVANTGDCGALIGSLSSSSSSSASSSATSDDDNDGQSEIIAHSLTNPHTTHNPSEVERLSKSHPENTIAQLTRDDRLLGELQPTRSFGDVRYKWDAQLLRRFSSQWGVIGGLDQLPSPYTSPPYLTSQPEVVTHKIDAKRDRFIILASDGLIDVLTNQQCVQIVNDCLIQSESGEVRGDAGEKWRANPASQLLKAALAVPNQFSHEMIREDVESTSSQQQNYSTTAEQDDDSRRRNLLEQIAIRHISMHLALKPGVARYFRDDLTVMVLSLI